MTFSADIAAITDLQAQMIAALDRQDVAAIEAATSALATASARLTRHGVLHADEVSIAQINQALRHNQAAKSRLAFLGARNRQKIDALAAMRSGQALHSYTKP
jgi:hypothetical protein